MAPPNARDEQVIRETLLQSTPHVRDEQIVRESLIQLNPNVRDLQIFRETLLIRGTATRVTPVVFAVT
jgi:hypothetical protein